MRISSQKRNQPFIIYQAIFLLFVFAIGKIGFTLYNSEEGILNSGDLFDILWHGLPMDLNTTGLLLILPLAVFSFTYWKKLNMRAILSIYYVIIGILTGLIIVADAVMYPFWKFKLSEVVLSYAASPEGASSSVSIWFIVSRILAGVLLIAICIWGCIRLTPKKLPKTTNKKLLFICWTTVLACLIPHPTHTAYYSDTLAKNHAAVNPVLNFYHSWHPRSFDTRYKYMEDTVSQRMAHELYPQDTEGVTLELLATKRPNILIVLMESFGSQFIEEMGGMHDVAPHLGKLAQEGLFWTRYYSNSFRTDRGTVSAFSGYLSYPDVGLMREKQFHPHLNSLANTLNESGYSTTYLYPGAMTNMGKGTYLADMKFQTLLDNKHFTAEELDSPWGAHDGNSARKTFEWIKEQPTGKHWMMVYQTVSSHEPFDVPYHRLEDKVQNAFAYTDKCVGQLVDSLKTLPQWKDMLVILIPDHGFLYRQTLQNPEFFHSPMIWTGGAIRKFGKMNTLMNQSDLAATLLSQLGISHKDYPWSRNVLSQNYTTPFVYCNYPAGFLFADETGYSMFDLSADVTISSSDEKGGKADSERVRKGQAILQDSYIKLEVLKTSKAGE